MVIFVLYSSDKFLNIRSVNCGKTLSKFYMRFCINVCKISHLYWGNRDTIMVLFHGIIAKILGILSTRMLCVFDILY
jgi:hypothetical protein